MAALPNGGVRFGAFEVHPQSGELRKHGRRIKLQDQPFKILVALLERPGEVVTRDELRERLWGNDTFVDFEHGVNAAVKRLRDALGDSAENPRYVESMARRGYRFIAAVHDAPCGTGFSLSPPSAATLGDRAALAPATRGFLVRSNRRPAWVVFAALAALGTVAGIGLWLTRQRAAPSSPRLMRLTAFTGSEDAPAFSPDGNQVAFVWNGDKGDNSDIYFTMVGSATALRLTNDPAVDTFPAWSPDGRQIVFLSSRVPGGIYLVSPLGGPERKLIDLDWAAARPSWSPDGKFVAVSRLYREPPQPGDGAVLLVPVEGGVEPRDLLVPQPGTRYLHPTFSPDGRELAIALCKGLMCQLQVVPLNRELAPTGPPRTIRSGWSYVYGIAWMPDSGSLVVSGFRPPDHHLWRVTARTASEPERIELAGDRALRPAISPKGNRLAFARSISKPDVWRWERGRKPAVFLSSTVRDTSPQFSPDGQRIAFESARGGGEIAIWVANADGTGPVQITTGLGSHSGTPRWSPRGRWLAFDSQAKNGRFDVWTVEAGGSPPRKLTDGPADNFAPSWSRDGKRVYFTSNRSGRYEIWRVAAEGGTALQVTRGGGFAGVESVDGKTLFYTRSASGTEGLYALTLDGREERHVLADQVACRSFAVFPDCIYYVSPRRGELHEIRLHEFASGRNQPVGEIEGPLHFGFSVSPDRKRFLFSNLPQEYDLMLIENFR